MLEVPEQLLDSSLLAYSMTEAGEGVITISVDRQS